jgi:glycosyltransferase involved in cell wall biosynthesis
MTTPEKICVIIPAFKEAARIGAVVRAVRAQALDVVVVDDGSPDATAATAEAAGAVVLRHEVNRGKGAALETAFQFARARGYTAVVTLDGDGQHDPADLPALLAVHAQTGAPVVVGNRMAANATMPRVRRWTNQFMSWLLSCCMGQRVPDTQCGYRLYRVAVLPTQPLGAARFAAESEILLDLAARGVRFAAAPVRTIYRDEKSKINPVVDTVRFLGMMLRHAARRKRG